MTETLRILVPSSTPWSRNNSFGRSYSDIFGDAGEVEIWSVYFKYGTPDSDVVHRAFQITEKSLIANFFCSGIPSGREVDLATPANTLGRRQSTVFDHARRVRFRLYFAARELIWRFGRWKSPELLQFLDEASPDVIFQPLYSQRYLNRMAAFIQQYCDAPMVTYVSDDVYGLRTFSLSPLHWLDVLGRRPYIRTLVERSEFLYVISEVQRSEYLKLFGKECKVLTRGLDFSDASRDVESARLPTSDRPLRLVYTGNIGNRRWKTLAMIASELESLNADVARAELVIYTSTPLTAAMRRVLLIPGTARCMGEVPSDQIAKIQDEADILVHVEPTDLAGRLIVHQSFSTKLVDYFHAAKCIFAVGTADVASIQYLSAHDAAVIATSKKDVVDKLRQLISDASLRDRMARKAWACGRENHEGAKIRAQLINELHTIARLEFDEASSD